MTGPQRRRSTTAPYEAGATVLMAMWALGAIALLLTGHGGAGFLCIVLALVIERQTRLAPGLMDRVICAWLGHRPALVSEPCRCRRCGRMIRWTRKRDASPGAGWRALEGK